MVKKQKHELVVKNNNKLLELTGHLEKFHPRVDRVSYDKQNLV
jgi:hypothetical protein